MSTYPASFPEHSPRNANYSIDVELDPSTKTMTGREVVTWRNITSKPTSELQFHTYWNAWRNTRSTFMREWLRVNGGTPEAAEVLSRPPSDWSSLDVTAVRLLSGGATAMTDLMPATRYIAPDDGNPEDRTVLAVNLPQAVATASAASTRMRFLVRVACSNLTRPVTVANTV